MVKVSVIVPAYNAMKYLPETLDTVLQQSLQDFEVIIVDDGSSDAIEAWASQLTDSRVQLLSQVNQGPSAARNNGIASAQGEYIAFLDADDLWDSTKLEKQVEILDRQPAVGLVYTWVSSVDEHGVSRGRVIKNYDEGDVWQVLLLHNIVECGSTPMVRRACFDQLGVFDQAIKYVEDRDMWLRIASRYQFAVIQEPLVYYRQHSNSGSRNWEVSEQGTQVLLERAFANAPAHLTAAQLTTLKQLSYGRASLNFAWKPLQSKARDYRIAMRYRQQALTHCPQLRFSKEFVRLSVAIALMRLLGPDRYDQFLSMLYLVRRQLLRTA